MTLTRLSPETEKLIKKVKKEMDKVLRFKTVQFSKDAVINFGLEMYLFTKRELIDGK